MHLSRLFKPRVCSGSRLRSTLRASPTTKPMAATLAMNKNGNWTAGELQDDCNFLLYSIHLGIKAEREKMVKRVTGAGRKSGPRQESEAKADIDAEAKKLREREEDLMAKVVAAMKGGSAPGTGRGIGNWRPSAADAGSAEAPARKKGDRLQQETQQVEAEQGQEARTRGSTGSKQAGATATTSR